MTVPDISKPEALEFIWDFTLGAPFSSATTLCLETCSLQAG